MRQLRAERVVSHPPERVHAFLAELGNHWRLDDRLLRLERLDGDGDGGRIAIRGPLGLRRTARIRLTDVVAPHRVVGEAAVGRRTCARVTWSIAPHASGSRVAVEAVVLSAGVRDRLLLAAGGRRWMGRRFDAVLAQLALALREAPPAPVRAAA